ncbi:glycosyltransferase [Hymenobacter sp. PAMC 26628]|uniref:glycosyltransferase n=1 Tax=Hymenobacter sp. PAMC 26628 TaxID=1484118 RepID=UPI000770057B|nr:glycosyltransferase [Hymenobacter sp. PAMC 26628]AMJ67849.1 hypothetical protein AXW84_22335 [Hymenobacter sp. PAMC 26628]
MPSSTLLSPTLPSATLLASESIALIIPDFDTGGEEKRVVFLANHYAQIFKQVYLFAPRGLSNALLSDRVRHVVTAVRSPGSLAGVVVTIRREGIRFLQGHKRATLPYLVMAEKLTGAACVFNFDNIYPRHNYASKLLSPRHLVYLSDVVKDFYAPYYPGRHNVTINMGGNFYPVPSPAERKRRREAWGLADEFVLLNLGRLAPQKNHPLLFEALRQLPGGNFVCLVAGSGPDEARLQALARAYGLQDKVRFLGHIAEPYPLLCAADALVQSSDYEGFPNAFIEAASVGLPIVATDVGSARTLVGPAGILVPPGAADQLAAALVAMQQQLATYQQRAEALRTSGFFQQFHKLRMAENYVRYYEALANTP